ncbi:hypothetical protein [Rubrobacter indicoceani]|uniref:hypothetical protein n=1 Tax=Rubrobacter indicoceani TaxID=2051957 RepID=UPI0013C46515|nr:hypothetical protein [Rubrobacter indicoceani]
MLSRYHPACPARSILDRPLTDAGLRRRPSDVTVGPGPAYSSPEVAFYAFGGRLGGDVRVGVRSGLSPTPDRSCELDRPYSAPSSLLVGGF